MSPRLLRQLRLAAREQLDNLIFVVNCNLQRLDGPVRGNGKIIQELETIFRGVGWNVLKTVLGEANGTHSLRRTKRSVVDRLTQLVDGEYQKFYAEGPVYATNIFSKVTCGLVDMVRGYSDQRLRKLRVGGHDPQKVYAAYNAAIEHKGSPTVVLAKTVKGYGLGAAGEGMNITHRQKRMNEEELRHFSRSFQYSTVG